MIRAARTHAGVWAALAHRLSGLMLALFLPFHFLALGLAIEGEAELDAFLQWSEQPLVKFGEWGLVVLLSVHFAFGLRVLAIEFLSWPGHLKQMIGAGAGGALLVGVIFLMNAA
jgi:fumarate reductase subunit D